MDFNALWNSILDTLGGSLPTILGALAILVAGWFVALVVRAAVRRSLKLVGLNKRLASGTEKPLDVESGISTGAYYVVLVLALIAFLNVLGLGLVSGPLEAFAQRVFDYMPQLFAGAALTLVAWLVASVLRKGATHALASTQVDEKLSSAAGVKPISESAGQTLYALTLLVFLPAILGAFGITGLLGPVQSMVDEGLSMLPNVLAAVLLGVVGWIVARIVRSLAVHLMNTVGADRIGVKAGLREGALGRLVGVIAFAAILLPASIAALHALQIEAVSVPATQMLEQILTAVPSMVAAGLVLALAWFGGRLLADLSRELLAGVGIDSVPQRLGFKGDSPQKPSRVIGSLVAVFVMLLALGEAGSMLGFDQISNLVGTLVSFGGQVLLGCAVIAVGLWLANLAQAAIRGFDSRYAGPGAEVARFAILGLVFAMGLRAMGIAEDIVNLAFGLTLGSIAVAGALAFGLGGREAAGRQLEHWFSGLRGERGRIEDQGRSA